MPKRIVFDSDGDRFSVNHNGDLILTNYNGDSTLVAASELEQFTGWVTEECARFKSIPTKPKAAR